MSEIKIGQSEVITLSQIGLLEILKSRLKRYFKRHFLSLLMPTVFEVINDFAVKYDKVLPSHSSRASLGFKVNKLFKIAYPNRRLPYIWTHEPEGDFRSLLYPNEFRDYMEKATFDFYRELIPKKPRTRIPIPKKPQKVFSSKN